MPPPAQRKQVCVCRKGAAFSAISQPEKTRTFLGPASALLLGLDGLDPDPGGSWAIDSAFSPLLFHLLLNILSSAHGSADYEIWQSHFSDFSLQPLPQANDCFKHKKGQEDRGYGTPLTLLDAISPGPWHCPFLDPLSAALLSPTHLTAPEQSHQEGGQKDQPEKVHLVPISPLSHLQVRMSGCSSAHRYHTAGPLCILCVSPIIPIPEQDPASEAATLLSSSLVLWGGCPAGGFSPLHCRGWGSGVVVKSRVWFSLCPEHWAETTFQTCSPGKRLALMHRGETTPVVPPLLGLLWSNDASVGKAGASVSF